MSYNSRARMRPSWRDRTKSPKPIREKEPVERNICGLTGHIVNTIIRGFAEWGGSISFFHPRHTFAHKTRPTSASKFTLSHRDIIGILPHEDEPMVISVLIFN